MIAVMGKCCIAFLPPHKFFDFTLRDCPREQSFLGCGQQKDLEKKLFFSPYGMMWLSDKESVCQRRRRGPTRLFWPWNFPGRNTGRGCHFLLQGIFLTKELNPCLLHADLQHTSLYQCLCRHWSGFLKSFSSCDCAFTSNDHEWKGPQWTEL